MKSNILRWIFLLTIFLSCIAPFSNTAHAASWDWEFVDSQSFSNYGYVSGRYKLNFQGGTIYEIQFGSSSIEWDFSVDTTNYRYRIVAYRNGSVHMQPASYGPYVDWVFDANLNIGLSSASTTLDDDYDDIEFRLYRKVRPSITVTSANQTVSTNPSNKTITITGKVWVPKDNGGISVSATIDGVKKSTTVGNYMSGAPQSTPSSDNFTLQWDVVSDSIAAGTYTNIPITAVDASDEGDDDEVPRTVNYTGTITVDTTPPAAPAFSQSPTTPTNGNVTVTINYAADASVKQYKIGAGSYQTYTGPVTLTANNTVTALAQDAAGNQSTAVLNVTNIDKTPPVAPTFSQSPAAPTNGNVTVTITYPADASVKQYKIGTGSYQAYMGPVTLTANDTVTALAQDAVGNQSTAVLDVTNIDKTPPVAPTFSQSPTAPTNGNVTVTITYPADASLKQYKIGPGSYQTYTGPVTLTTNDTVTALVQDAAGNQSTAVHSVTNIDKTPPAAPTFSQSPTAPTNGNVTVTITYPADASVKQYKIGSGSYQTYTGPVTITDNDTVTALAQDAAGNQTTAVHSVTNIDKTPPAVPTITESPAGNAPSKTITINYSADSVTKQYQIDSGAWQIYSGSFMVTQNSTITAKASDAAGNISTGTLAITTIVPADPIPIKSNVTDTGFTVTDQNMYDYPVEYQFVLYEYGNGTSIMTTPWQDDSSYNFTNLLPNKKYTAKINVRYK